MLSELTKVVGSALKVNEENVGLNSSKMDEILILWNQSLQKYIKDEKKLAKRGKLLSKCSIM